MQTSNTNHLTEKQIRESSSVYSPKELVDIMLSKIDDKYWSDPTKTFCDPTCGTGAIIIPILDKRVKYGVDALTALKTMYGNELIKESYDILMCNLEEWAKIHNITDTSWKDNFFNMDVHAWFKLIEDKSSVEDFFE